MRPTGSRARQWAAATIAVCVLVVHAAADAQEPPHPPPFAPAPDTASAGGPQSMPAFDLPRPQEGKQGHLAILDHLVVYAALGGVTGAIQRECGAKSPWGPVLGVSFLGALSALFTEPMEENPFVVRHPPHPATRLAGLRNDLRHASYKRPTVHVTMDDGTTITGVLARVEPDSVVLSTAEGLTTIEGHAIYRIDTTGDPPWDQLLFGLAGGAGWGLIWANNCSEGSIPASERGRWAGVGAAIMGATGLVLDLMHDGRFLLYGPAGDTQAATLRLAPVATPGGAGVAVVARF